MNGVGTVDSTKRQCSVVVFTKAAAGWNVIEREGEREPVPHCYPPIPAGSGTLRIALLFSGLR